MAIDKTVDRESQQKLYVQIYSIIREKIESREWPSGSQIPTEDELCRMYDVSKATVRLAITELVRTGYLKKQQGKGTFVTYTEPDLGIAMQTRLTENMFGEGVNTKREILVKGLKRPPEDVRAVLKSDDEVFYVLCKRLVGGEPAYLEELFIPPRMFPEIEEDDICQLSFSELIRQRTARRINRVIQTVEITGIRGEAAKVLRTEDGAPGLLLHRLLVGSDGTPVAYARLTGSGTKYKLQTELERIA